MPRNQTIEGCIFEEKESPWMKNVEICFPDNSSSWKKFH